MMATKHNSDSDPSTEFSAQAESYEPGIVREFLDFLRYNKKWWMTPIIVVLALVGMLAVAGSSSVTPFLYTIF